MIAAHGLETIATDGARLAPVSFEIASGECLGVTGVPGSGRTTLLEVVATEARPSSGRLLIDGIDVCVRLRDARRRIASGRGDVRAGWGLTAAEYVAMVAACRGVDPHSDRASLAWQAVARAGIRARSLVSGLSSEEGAALSLATVYIAQTPVLVIDDRCHVPAGARAALHGCLSAALEHGAAILLVTDDDLLRRRVCRRELQLPAGRVVPCRPQRPLEAAVLEQG